jgi:hypothetical protein
MKNLRKYYLWITVTISIIVYLFTIAPSVIQIDSGELATVQIKLGIAHPTGYPLFTILGYIFSLIPVFSSKIFQMNLLALIFVSAGVGLFTYSVKLLLDNIQHFNKERVIPKKKKSQSNTPNDLELSDNEKKIIAIVSGLILAFSKTFWFQSTSVEVYSLQIFLFSLIVLFLLKSYIYSSEQNKYKPWFVFAIVLALGFSNHMTTLLVLPATAYLYFLKNRFDFKSFRRLFLMIISFFILLIIIYSYFPIRAIQNPVLNWGNPVDLERIIRHVSGFQYQVWLFSSMDSAKKQFAYYFSNLPKEFYITLLLSAIGIFFTFKNHIRFFIFNNLIFVFTVIYSINYDINDIDSYFLLSYFSLSYFSVFGMIWIIKKIPDLRNNYKIAVFLLFPIIQLSANFSSVNQSNNYIYEDYTKTLLKSLPKNSVIFGYQWDYFISPAYYFQFVEDYRKDIAVIDKELLRRSWYFNQIETSYPDILSGMKTEIGLFLNALKPFERKENFDSNLLESLYRRIMTNLVSTNFDKREIHLTPEIIENEMQRGEFSLPPGYDIVPYLLTFKVVNSKDYVEAPLPDFELRIDKIKDRYQIGIINIVSSMLLNRAIYERLYNKDERAKVYIKKALEINPETQIPNQLRDLVFD